jgi:DNA-binding transcriptional MocR family regulator
MWHPALRQGTKPIHDQLIDALARDVASGTLPPGTKLPPHRDLAYRLKIGVGTVTKVYAEARRRGLLTATVGRGSFIAGQVSSAEDTGLIDFSRNLSPMGLVATRFSDALSTLRRRSDLADHLTYPPPAGMASHRQAGAKWLAASVGLATVDWQRLIVCEGGQHAMALAFASLCKHGDTVLCESATFLGMKSLAEQLGLRLAAVKMDEQGLLPDAFDRAAAGGARVVYTIPTLQNPTGRVMSLRRRTEIAAIARKRDVTIVEDDVYGAFAHKDNAAPAIATIAPERTFYISSLSKTVAPGLRCGYLLTPDESRFDRVIRTVRAFSYAPASLGALIGTQWIEDGTASDLATSVRREIAERTDFAARFFGKTMERPHTKAAPHIWLPMSELKAERVAGAALRAGAMVTPVSAPLVDAKEISGLRLCIGAPADMATLERGLQIVAGALSETPDTVRSVI